MSPRKNAIDRLIESTYDFGRIMRQQMIGHGKNDDGTNLLHIHSLFLISDTKGMTMKQLADSLHISSPSATSLVNRLVRSDWVTRVHDEANRKLVRLSLTPAGKRILQTKHERRRQVLRRIFGLLTTAEQTELARLHEKLSSKLSALSSH